MRILVIGPKEYPFGSGSLKGELPGGGTDVFFENLSNSIKSEEIEFHLVTQKHNDQLTFEKIENLFVYRVPWRRGRYRTVIAHFWAFIRSLKIDFDIILTILEPPLIFGYFLSKLKQKKLLCRLGGLSGDAHKLENMQIELKFLKAFNRFVLPKSTKVIFASEREKKVLETNLNINLPNSAIIKTGIKKVGDLKIVPNKNKPFTILYLGRLEKVKGVDILLKSIKKVENAVLWIVGSGREENELKRFTHKYNLSDRVKFWGFSKNIKYFLLSSDIFVLPSRSEGTPHSLIEAMSTGLPAIVSDIGLECIKEGVSGLTFSSGDSEDLAKKINYLLSDFELRKEIGYNAKQFFENSYSLEKMSYNYKKIFIES